MNASVEDLRGTIVPKSDQLNAEQLLGGPMTVTITDVRMGASEEQPVVVHYEGEAGRPYKPCKTMRKLLIHAWGADGRVWIGRSMTLYCDPDVKFGGEAVGGIRISHMSDIKGALQVSLTSTRGKKAKYRVERLAAAPAAAKARQAAPSKSAEAENVEKQVKDGNAEMAADFLTGLAEDAFNALWAELSPAAQDAINAIWSAQRSA